MRDPGLDHRGAHRSDHGDARAAGYEKGRARVDATTAVEGGLGVWRWAQRRAPTRPAGPGLPADRQHAVRQVKVTAHTVAAIEGREPTRFTYRTLGVFVDLGPRQGGGERARPPVPRLRGGSWRGATT